MAFNSANDDTVQLIRETADIAEVIGTNVTLKQAGTNLKGLCPFHSEKTPSFTVNRERRTFHCFGCGEGGDVFTFVMKYNNLDFPGAIKELARRYNIDLPERNQTPAQVAQVKKREVVHEANATAAQLFHDLLINDPKAQGARDYLATRKVPKAIIKEFQLGFAPDSWDYLTRHFTGIKAVDAAIDAGLLVARDNGGYYDRFRSRLVFPIIGQTGKTVGFSGRILGDGQPKYLNSPESIVFDKGRTVFGAYQNRAAIRKANNCILVEGNFDLLSMVIHDLRNVAAPLGTALTQSQVRLLKGYAKNIVLLFDGDTAGIKAAMRAVPLFLSEQISAQVAILPSGHDPDTYLGEFGPQKLSELIDNAQSLPEYVFAHLVTAHGLDLDGKSKIISELRPLIKATSDQQSQRSLFAAHFSEKLGISVQQLMKGTTPSPTPPPLEIEKNSSSIKEMSLKERQLLEFLIIFPEYLKEFFAAGITGVVINDCGQRILACLKDLHEQGSDTDRLLDFFSGNEKSFISALLITLPEFSDEEKEAAATEKIAWLKQFSLQLQQKKLTKQIDEAQQAQDVDLCLELIEKKRELDRSLAI